MKVSSTKGGDNGEDSIEEDEEGYFWIHRDSYKRLWFKDYIAKSKKLINDEITLDEFLAGKSIND